MHTSLLLVVLAGGLTAGADAGSLNWATDYAQAKKQAKEAGKPLAIFLNEGDAAAAKLLTDGNLSGTTQQLLSSDYVALFINTATPAGKDLAGKFDLPGGKGIVVSDRSGVYQALRHEGETSNSQLETYLKKYADPTFVVRTTDSNTTARTSFYQGNGQYVPVTVGDRGSGRRGCSRSRLLRTGQRLGAGQSGHHQWRQLPELQWWLSPLTRPVNRLAAGSPPRDPAAICVFGPFFPQKSDSRPKREP